MHQLEHQIEIDAPATAVFAALATQAGLRSWWTADTVADSEVGGKADFGFDRRATVFRMRIEALDPDTRVVWSCSGEHPEWKGTRLTWSITSKGDHSEVRLTHSGWKSITDFCATCNSTWGELMYRLKDHVEGRHPGPHWRE